MENRVFMNPPGIGCSYFNEPSALTPALSPAGERGSELLEASSLCSSLSPDNFSIER
jgi:hypothetical protein